MPPRTQQLFDGALELAAADKAPWVPGAFPEGLPSAQPMSSTRPRPPPGLRVLSTQRLQKITNAPSANLLGLVGTDLGVPVEHDGQLYLFFGDAELGLHVVLPGTVSVGTDIWVRPMAIATDLLDGREIQFLANQLGPLKWAASFDVKDVDNTWSWYLPQVAAAQVSPQIFDVPTGAFSHAGRLHVFRMRKTGFEARDESELRLRYLVNDDKQSGVVGGRSVLESASDPRMFAAEQAVEVCDIRRFGINELRTKWKFSQVCPQVARGADIPELGVTGDVLLLWGTGAFRQSDVCFAWAALPDRNIPPPTAWRYFSGLSGVRPEFTYGDMESAIGLLTWSDRSLQSNETSFVRSDYTNAPWPPGVGEFSVTYVPAFGAWLMLLTGPGTVLARLATKPWGPWGEPAVVLPHGVLSDIGGFYAPFALPTLTRWYAATQSVDLHFLGSFLTTPNADQNGNVYLYRAKLQLDTSRSRTIPSGVLPPRRRR